MEGGDDEGMRRAVAVAVAATGESQGRSDKDGRRGCTKALRAEGTGGKVPYRAYLPLPYLTLPDGREWVRPNREVDRG
jgi:hypothetical protein